MNAQRTRPTDADHKVMVAAVSEHADTVSVLHDRKLRRTLNAHMKAMGVMGGPTNLAVFAEAMRREIPITAMSNRGMKLHGDPTHWWNNGHTSLNHLAFRRIGRQKEVNSRILRTRGVRAPENAVFAPGEGDRAWGWAEAILPVVIKPYAGSKGRGVHTRLTERSEFIAAFDEVSGSFGEVLVEQQLEGTEHRVFIVDNKVRAALRQIPANVVGDGRSSVSELIAEKNKTALHPHKPIALEAVELKTLSGLGLNPESIVDDGSRLFLRQNTNLSTGGDSIDATAELTSTEIDFVRAAAKCWPGLGFAGIDVMLPRKSGDDPPAVIEINTPAGISAHLMPRFGKPRNVAEAIVDTMFSDRS